jgi:ribosome maturation factor RimP
MQDDPLFGELERHVEPLGYELVELERGGTPRRPVLRARIDRPGSAPGAGVTVDDCARVSRALEAYLDQREDLSDRYVLEVSSPGVERPLVRPRDWERFAGQEVVIRGKEPLVDGSTRVEGVLLGLESGESESVAGDRVRLRLPSGREASIPLAAIRGANLVFRWGE